MKPVADDIRLKNRAGLATPGVAVAAPDEPAVTVQTTALDMRKAYERYKIGKGFGRADLFLVLIEHIEELERRIGSVDEAAVSVIEARVTALETGIGNALRASADEPPRRGPGRPPKTQVTDAANG